MDGSGQERTDGGTDGQAYGRGWRETGGQTDEKEYVKHDRERRKDERTDLWKLWKIYT